MRTLLKRLRASLREAPAPEPVPGDVPSGEPSIAVVTMASDEGEMLGLWVEHYARQVGRDHLIVFDDGSTDGSTKDLGCTVHTLPPMPGGAGFEKARTRLVSGVADGLLASYDYVVFVDADEFLVTDPEVAATLPELLALRRRPEVVGALALNVMHLPGEAPLELGRPILEQRSYAKFTPLMCKPSIKRIPAPWGLASHGIRAPYAVDPALYLLHLKFADRDRLAAMAARRNEAHAADGRAGKSSWSMPADDLLETFDAVTTAVDPATVPEFEASAVDLADLVRVHEQFHRTPRQGQVQALREQPMVRIPASLRGEL